MEILSIPSIDPYDVPISILIEEEFLMIRLKILLIMM